jgi:hypothetical protein
MILKLACGHERFVGGMLRAPLTWGCLTCAARSF